MTPNDRRYSKTHEWIKLDDDIAIIGITNYAQEMLGDITYVELPSIGEAFEQDDECGVIESVKAASDIFMPIDGEVVEVNTKLEKHPNLINKSPYEQGWIIKIKNFKIHQYNHLMDSSEYEAFLETEEMKDDVEEDIEEEQL